MSKENKITSYQLFSILFLIDIIIVLTYSPKLSSSSGIRDFVISSGIYFISNFILVLPIYFLYKKSPHLDIFSGKLKILYRFVYSIYFLWIACYTISIFKIFIINVMSPEIPVTLLIVFTTTFAIYAASRGIHAIVRTSVIVLVIIEFSLMLMFLSLFSRVEQDNYVSFFEHGFSDTIKGLLYMIARDFTLPIILVLFPIIEGGSKKTFISWNIASTVFFIAMDLLLVGSLGKYIDTQLFPGYIYAQISDIGVFKHLDAIYIGFFSMGIFILIATFLYLFLFVCKDIKSQSLKHKSNFIGLVIVFILGCFLPDNKNFNYFIFNKYALLILTLTVSVILPLVSFIISSNENKQADL
ncbi:MAG: GerAB/ArcD/ProY family transporter [Clostridia bacterium]|nr:GerAB/ArcD/ProY family transporter [Clostridia bacterium]